ncbi:hypothetical protein V6Z11_D13G068000 [Gossypium hirsutum]
MPICSLCFFSFHVYSCLMTHFHSQAKVSREVS